MKIDDGLVCEKATRQNAKFLADIRSEIEAQYEKKLAEAKIKIEAELKQKIFDQQQKIINELPATNTLKRMPKFGSQTEKTDFCWPDDQVLNSLKLDQSIKIKSFNYRITTNGTINQI